MRSGFSRLPFASSRQHYLHFPGCVIAPRLEPAPMGVAQGGGRLHVITDAARLRWWVGEGRYSLALLSARVLRLPEMSRLLNRHTTLASTFPLAVCK